MRRTISALLAAALMALGTPALAEEVQAPELIEPVGVQLDTAVVVRQDICELRYYDAAVVPHTEELCFTVDGSIKSIDALSGDWVSKGDVLATLDQEALEEQADDTRLHIDSAYISASALSAADALYARVGGNDYEIAPREFNWREYVAIALSGGELRTEFDFASDIPETVESGMYAAVFVKSGSVEDALVVPANALYSDSNGRYVYRIEDGKRVRAQVTTGRATTTLVQITDGLEEGDLVYVKE